MTSDFLTFQKLHKLTISIAFFTGFFKQNIHIKGGAGENKAIRKERKNSCGLLKGFCGRRTNLRHRANPH